MKHQFFFFLMLAIAGLFNTGANAQCIYTTIKDGRFSDPGIYVITNSVTGTITGGCTGLPAPGSTIVINHKIVLDQNFASTGIITISATGALTQDGTNRSFTMNNGTFTVAATTSRGLPRLAIAVFDMTKTTFNLGNYSVVQVTCTLLPGNQAMVNLGNNASLNVFGNIDVSTGNPSIEGPAVGPPASVRIIGNIVGNQGGGNKLFGGMLITCVEGKQVATGCVVTSTKIVSPPTGNDPSCRSVLPVTLTRFSGSRTSQGNVELNWATATELNSDYFAVERSANAINFETLARITASGTSTNAKIYAFTDDNPLQNLAYYRLRQMDYDGKATYSPVVAIAGVRATTGWLVPSAAPQHYFIKAELDANSRFVVMDIMGRTVFAQAINPENAEISLPILPTGVYLFRLLTQHGKFTVRQAVTAAN